ncbi:MAG: hypothetical protein Q9M10_03880 [Mariprofundaceae bacterium]|nr:hypothetical protein [Mariprofundaceae bacterium]
MYKMMKLCWGSLLAVSMLTSQMVHAKTPSEPELFPVSSYLSNKHQDLVYPSIAGNFLVYNEVRHDEFSVVRVQVDQADMTGKRVDPMMLNEALREGVALSNGGIGYVSNRIGPMSAWLWNNGGDTQIAIANMALYRGGLIPEHLNVSVNGKIWCFDATLQKVRHNELLSEFAQPIHRELIGQAWRMYDSNYFMYKMGYKDTKKGTHNKFDAPALFIFNRENSELSMLPKAFDGAISPDGKKIAFVRNVEGNYDLWLQNIDGTGLTQLTTQTYGDFEPAFSPDGKQLAFVSNRDSEGSVRQTSLYVMDLSTGKVKRITNAPEASDGGVAWADMHTLIFHSNRDLKHPRTRTSSNWNLWKVEIE